MALMGSCRRRAIVASARAPAAATANQIRILPSFMSASPRSVFFSGLFCLTPRHCAIPTPQFECYAESAHKRLFRGSVYRSELSSPAYAHGSYDPGGITPPRPEHERAYLLGWMDSGAAPGGADQCEPGAVSCLRIMD